jgi:acyl-CoA dehydrogenase
MWVLQVKAVDAKLKAGANGDAERLETKLVLAKFFMERMLPETGAHLARISSGSDTIMALAADRF